ncbi:MAG TPA: MBL fold metallo-hydrolase [Pyrinomonadaceae bacterium]|jgi:glyoxylase-like metal-dependent hydrolase (beta-lactamase superfamily II)/ferredoxin
MAKIAERLAENVGGDFYVDASCIDCDACRQIAPATFRDHGNQSSVYRQPSTPEETRRALMALTACPTASIGVAAKGRYDMRAGIDAFPSLIAENVYFCGFTSESSFGAWSYLIVRPASEGGNVLVDSPRLASTLVKKIAALGGIRTIFLTHRDDIAEHAAFAAKFGAKRIMHAADGAARHGVEQVVEGERAVRLDDDLTLIPTPGHTRGHMVLLYKDRFLFTGDHLAWSPSRQTLTAFRNANWYSWPEQTRSMKRLLGYDFEWVLPGHGRIRHETKEEMRSHLVRCIEWMRTV